MPLRFVFRRRAATQLMGLMPAHRGGTTPAFSLKEIVIAPANAARGLDPHQGAVLLHDGETGVLQAILNASAITEIRTAAVSAVATKLLARPGRGASRSSAPASRRARTRRRCAPWSTTPSSASGAATPEHAEALALESHAVVCETVEEALDGAEIVCTCTAAREPIVRRAWLAPGTHVNAVGSSVPPRPRARRGDVVAEASLFVDRRESTLNESGDYPAAVEEAGIGPDHIQAELGELLVGAHPGRRARRRADGLQVARPRGRGSRRSGLSCAARASGARHRGRLLIPLEAIERARASRPR